jgi:hypothetical protein
MLLDTQTSAVNSHSNLNYLSNAGDRSNSHTAQHMYSTGEINNSNVPFANRKFAFRTARLFKYKRENLYNTTQGIRITPSNCSNLARTDRNRAKTASPSQNTLLSEMANIKIAQTPISVETLAECLCDRTSGGILCGLHPLLTQQEPTRTNSQKISSGNYAKPSLLTR